MKQFLTLKDIQAEELEMFKYFIDFCEKYNITYYIAGGTMLGAIRHKGFIPWDDDIDVYVPRPDFEKLIDLHQAYNRDTDYELATYRLGNLNRAYARVFNKNIHVEKTFQVSEFDNHLWMDIFPLDGLPSSKKEQKKIYRKIKCYRKLLGWKTSRFGTGKTLMAKLLKPLLKVILLPVSIDSVIHRINAIATGHPIEEADYVGEITLGLHGIGEVNPKEGFLPTIDVEFEGLTVKGMKDYDRYLSGKYGDYMVIPDRKYQEDHSIKVWREI